MKTVRRIIVDILIVVFLALFLLSLLYYRTGSLEMMPTEEDQEKIRGITMLGMFLFGGLCAIFTVIRVAFFRKSPGKRERLP